MVKIIKDEFGFDREVTVVSEDETKPFFEYEYKVTIKKYNPKFGDKRMCICGHPYHRHFDFYEGANFVGCKYCGCQDFVEKTSETQEYKKDTYRNIDEKPSKNGVYMVKFYTPYRPEYDRTELVFREFKDGEWLNPIYSSENDGYELVGWFEE